MNLSLSYKTLSVHPTAAKLLPERYRWISLDLAEPNLGSPNAGGFTNTYYLTSDPDGNRGWTDNINVDVNTEKLNALSGYFNVLTVRSRLCSFGFQNFIDTESSFTAFNVIQRGVGRAFLVQGSSSFLGSISGDNITTSFNQGSATGVYSFAINSSRSVGDYSNASGFESRSLGYASHAQNYYTTASGFASHAQGFFTTASGFASHAQGFQSIAFGAGSHAEGFFTAASGVASHAEGNDTNAIGDASHAEGGFTTAVGQYSHAGGYITRAEGAVSKAIGYRSIARHDFTFIWSDGNTGTTTNDIVTTKTGQYLVSASGGVFIPGKVGIGTDSTNNSLTVVGDISATGRVFSQNTLTASVCALSGNGIPFVMNFVNGLLTTITY